MCHAPCPVWRPRRLAARPRNVRAREWICKWKVISREVATTDFEAFTNVGFPCEDLDDEIFGRKTCNHLMRLADNKTVLYELSYVLPRVRHGYFAYLRGKGFSVRNPKKKRRWSTLKTKGARVHIYARRAMSCSSCNTSSTSFDGTGSLLNLDLALLPTHTTKHFRKAQTGLSRCKSVKSTPRSDPSISFACRI